MAATSAKTMKGESSSPTWASSSEARTPVDRLRRRVRRDASQDDSGVEINQKKVNGRNPKKRDGSPKVESPPKKPRRAVTRVVKNDAKAEKVGGRKNSTKRPALPRKAAKNEKPIRKQNLAKEKPPNELAKGLLAENRKAGKKHDTDRSESGHSSGVSMSETSRRPSRNQSKKSLKDISDDDIMDDYDDEEEYAPKKKKNRNKPSQEKGADLATSETSDSGAETEKPKKKRAPKPAKKPAQPKKTFMKPRRPDQNQLPSALKDNASGSSGVASSAHEQRLLLIARQMDRTAEDSDESSGNSQKATHASNQNVSKEDAISEEARRTLIMGMLKEHEDVNEMSDDSDDDDDCKTVEDKSTKKSSKVEHTKALPVAAEGSKTKALPVAAESSKTKDAPSGRQTRADKRKKAPPKVSTPTNGKQSKTQLNVDESSSSDDEDWEVVENATGRDPNYQRPDKVTVVLKNEDFLPDAKRLDMEQRIMRLINRRRKSVQHLSHQTHLLCLLAYQRYINSIVQDDTLRALALSCMPEELVLKTSSMEGGADSHLVKSILLFCKAAFELTESSGCNAEPFSVKYLKDKLRIIVTKRVTSCNIVYLLGIVLVMRAMGVPTRLCFSHRPISHKAKLLRRKDGEMVEFKSKSTLEETLGVLDYFAEVYIADRRCWRPVDIEEHRIINDPHEMGAHLDQPILYIASIDGEGAMKDLTPKYHSNWLSKGTKLRPEGRFFEDTLAHYAPAYDQEDHIEEQKEVADLHEKQGLPKTISECKNHPKYVLARHLLKFEAIYPRDTEILGYVNKEPVYPRECVKLLRSKDTWHRYGRQVREGEIAYNVVKARPKWDRRNEVMLKDLPLEVFGEWQTESYKPPEAKDGRVPRNKFGNVELFHEDMLPVGTVHLKLPGLHRIAEELGIDCVPAVVGFEGVARGCHPVLEGYVVCVEHKDTLEEAWREIQSENRRKRRERIRKRALKNWRKIIHKVMWNNCLNKKYKNNL